MSTLVRYTPRPGQDRLLDLAELNTADFAVISALHGQIHRGDKILLCQQASIREPDGTSRAAGPDEDGAEMYVKRIGDRYWAVHFPGSRCAEKHAIARESDEHRIQKDYWQRAAEDAGHPATQEQRTGAGTILDVAISGPRPTGIEVQHSQVQTQSVKARTTRSFQAGWLAVWFLDSDRPSAWFFDVPTVGSNPRPWSSLPPRRAATAIGPRRLVATRCTVTTLGNCPNGTRKRPKPPCGGFHPIAEPWPGLTVDDVAEQVPARRIVPIIDLRGSVRLIPHEDLDLLRDLTDDASRYVYQPGSRSRPGRRASRSTVCENPHDALRATTAPLTCTKCHQAPRGPGGVLCPRCFQMIASRPPQSFYNLAAPQPPSA
ncbi:hypothetical protein M8542_36035 [Amycolatopsis sp. OK19-0408]|uniref:Uncharacterized protein n=1 Tax=Amycolatopsis iheyensis TaxID=2945988 RepID=A0A9X2NKJ8_9PSEU|nr:hypothetical protein [Amycolatopsis iheyensis]MCR6488254.1 hypothetical protein [Amycolatopsis iheyensis]